MNGWRDYCHCTGDCVEDMPGPDGTVIIRNGDDHTRTISAPEQEVIEYAAGKLRSLGWAVTPPVPMTDA